MAIADILAKCGMTADDVARVAGKCMVDVRDKRTRAQKNEDKYEHIGLRDDNLQRTAGGVSGTGNVYAEIRAGFANGGCTTRAGTYRKFKTGSGRRGGRNA